MMNNKGTGAGVAHKLTNVKVTRDEKAWESVISAEIPADVLAHHREHALKEMQKDAKLDGFRPGKAPIDRILQIYGEAAVLRHAAQHAIEHELPELLAEQKQLIVEAPRVETETPKPGEALKFTARASLAPEVKLADYAKIAKKVNATKEEITVSDKEHTDALTHLKRERARIDKIEAGTEPQKAAEEAKALAEADLPALDDLFVQALGYESAEKFSEALRTNIKNEKEMQAAEKRRASILDELNKASTVHYPHSLLEYELDEMEGRMSEDVSRIGTTFENYLAQIKKTREELRKEWEPTADKRAKVRMILGEIARAEKIEPNKERVDHELEHAKKHFPQVSEENLRAHITHALRNEATLAYLESLA